MENIMTIVFVLILFSLPLFAFCQAYKNKSKIGIIAAVNAIFFVGLIFAWLLVEIDIPYLRIVLIPVTLLMIGFSIWFEIHAFQLENNSLKTSKQEEKNKSVEN